MTVLQKAKYYTMGDKAFYARVFAILLPLVIQNAITNIVSLLDNIMVGTIGTLQMSAVAIVNQLLTVFYLAIFGGYSGAGIFSAQYVGLGDVRGVRNCFRAKLYIGFFCLTVAFVVFLGFSESLISMYLADDTSAQDAASTMGFAIEYLDIMLIGIPAFALSQVYGSTLSEMGKTKVPMIASVSAILVNLFLNYVFIFGNEGFSFLPFAPLGTAGAAIATVVSRFVEAGIIITYVHTQSHKCPFIKGAYKSIKVPKELALGIVRRGTPVMVNEILWSSGMAAIMLCYAKRGLDVVAATNISGTVNNLFNVVMISMGSAIGIFIGHLLGANKIQEARVSVWRLLTLSVTLCTILGGIMALVAPYVPLIYETSDEVKSMATKLLYVVSCMMPFIAMMHGSYFAMRSGGKTMLTFTFDVGFVWCVAFPIAYLLATFTSLPIVPIFLCVQLVEVIKAFIAFCLVKSGIWIQNIVQ